MGQDRSDIRFAVKELSRRVAKPRRRDWRRLIRLGKYLVGKERKYSWKLENLNGMWPTNRTIAL